MEAEHKFSDYGLTARYIVPSKHTAGATVTWQLKQDSKCVVACNTKSPNLFIYKKIFYRHNQLAMAIKGCMNIK